MKENGFEYVDLGLPSKTMWATCNVGANNQEDDGLLFQFGRVDGYKYGDKNHGFVTEENYSTTSGKKYECGDILDKEDDAAHINMGGKWHMPTYNELRELYYRTTCKQEIVNGVRGIMFTSNINGQQLFIPFIKGYWDGHNNVFEHWDILSGFIYSSQVNYSNSNNSYMLFCYFQDNVYVDHEHHSYAFPVRGVFKK
ncbi:MAG: hypothetical protein ACI4P7_05975 [Bacilli bacterium]